MIYKRKIALCCLLSSLILPSFTQAYDLVLMAAPPDVQRDTPLPTVPVLYQNIAREYVVDATVEAINQSTISAQTSGQVLELFFDVDDRVKKGQVLMRFKDTEQKASLSQAQAQLKEAQARVKEATDAYSRLKTSHDRGATSSSALDSARANLDASRAQIAAAQAGLSKAQEQMEYTVVRAPYSGVVLKRHINIGEIANAGQALMTGFSLENLRALSNVSQDLIADVRKHSRARVLVGNGEQQHSIPAEKLTFAPYADENGHTFKVRVDLPPNTDNLYPGMFVKVAFVTGEEKRLVIPHDAIAFRGEVRAVYTLSPEDSSLNMRQIRIGKKYPNGMTEVLAGLEEGDQIVVNPVRGAVALKAQREQAAQAEQKEGAHE